MVPYDCLVVCLVFLDIAADDARLGGRIRIMTSEVLNYDLALGVAPDKAIGCGDPIQDAYIA